MIFLWLGLGLVVAVVAVSNLGYNVIGPITDGRKRAKSDRMFFDHYCATGLLTRFRRMNRHLPSSPRCKVCYVPFGGVGRVLGIKPSRKNSNFCRSCLEASPLGGIETEIGVLFADLRGFTAWATTKSPTNVASVMDDFYSAAISALTAHDAIIDKFAGDEVMALFISDMKSLGAGTCDQMLAAAGELLAAAREHTDALPIGIGLHYGTAWVGNVGSEDMKDFTALGDVVNVGARLQSCAGPGEIVLSPEVYAHLTDPPEFTRATFDVKGKDDPLRARVIEQAHDLLRR